MLKMKVHPTMCMKTKEGIKLCPVKSAVSCTKLQPLARKLRVLPKERRRRQTAAFRADLRVEI
jgi:hypothetical protein